MGLPFLGEIRRFAFTFAPEGWAACDGQVVPILQNEALFALIGNQYGGDGVTAFALPDLRSAVAVDAGGGLTVGQIGTTGGTTTKLLALTFGICIAGAWPGPQQ